jgi:hypothetical protein
MTQLVVLLCVLACPANMAVMMLLMRKGHRADAETNDLPDRKARRLFRARERSDHG